MSKKETPAAVTVLWFCVNACVEAEGAVKVKQACIGTLYPRMHHEVGWKIVQSWKLDKKKNLESNVF